MKQRIAMFAMLCASVPAWSQSTAQIQGVVQDASGGAVPGVDIAVAGGQSLGVADVLAGSLHSNTFDNLNLPLPFPDALQEFKVETSALTAQNGGHSGAAVNGITKSGTNEWHGDLFEFVRNY